MRDTLCDPGCPRCRDGRMVAVTFVVIMAAALIVSWLLEG